MSFQTSGNFGSNTTQSLKSALDSRVNIAQTERLGSQRQNLGEGLMCPASQNTLRLTDSACSHYTKWSAARRIQVENNDRPYLPICAAGLRGAADMMGVGRDNIPQNLYGEGYQGNMIRHYNTANNAPWHQGPDGPDEAAYYTQKLVQPVTFSMDGTNFQYRG